MKLPTVSENTATLTAPECVGAIVKARQTNAPSKHAGETAETRKADLHARLGDGSSPSEQILGARDTRTTAQLVRRHAIQRPELADEVIRR
jgi:hypothetical protein